MLLITLEEAQASRIGRLVGEPETARISIDLEAQHIGLADGCVMDFQIDTLRKTALLLGLDAIGSTLQRREQIKAFEREHLANNPWLG